MRVGQQRLGTPFQRDVGVAGVMSRLGQEGFEAPQRWAGASGQRVGVTVGGSDHHPTVVVLNGDVEHVIVEALRQKWAAAVFLFPLADRPARTTASLLLTVNPEAEGVPGVSPERQA